MHGVQLFKSTVRHLSAKYLISWNTIPRKPNKKKTKIKYNKYKACPKKDSCLLIKKIILNTLIFLYVYEIIFKIWNHLM